VDHLDGVPRPTIVCTDELLLDQLRRLCAAAGVQADVVPDPGQSRATWTRAPLVVVGGESAERTAQLVNAGQLARRTGVILASADLDDAEVWRRGVEVGAEHVVFLPEAEPWLVDRLSALAEEGAPPAAVLAVAGGCGGAGASVLGTALAIAGLQSGMRTMLVDADLLGGGLDLAVGAEHTDGLRWPALAGTRGRLSASVLTETLPSLGDLTVLSWDRRDAQEATPEAMDALVDAGRRASQLVVIDLPRRLDAAARVALARAATTLLVVPADVRACAAAARVAYHFQPECADLRLVVRGPGALAPAAVQDALDIPLVAYLRTEPAVAQALERGEPPGRRGGALARVSRRLLADVIPSPKAG
jgi:secretion/DNA translocation related CpaE-like protein